MQTDNERSDKTNRAGGVAGVKLKDSYYDILNVSTSATKTEIRESYIRLKNTYGAQSQALYSLMSDEQAQASLTKIEEAFRALNDEGRRQIYDRELGVIRPAPTTTLDYTDLKTDARTEKKPLAPIATKSTSASKEEVQDAMRQLITDSDAGDGDLYRRLRELAGVSAREMQERTKVTSDYLRAMESNTFDRLPQAVFVKGFLRSYLRYICAPDADRLVNAYAERLRDWQSKQRSN